jgi:exonuclease VII large subunit
LQQRQTKVDNLRKILDVINPQQVLERGYALVEQTKNGRLVQDKKQVSTGENITVTLRRGRLYARVEAKGD